LLPGEYEIVVTHVAYDDTRALIEIQPFEVATIVIPVEQEIVQTGTIVINGLTMRQPSSVLGAEAIETQQLERHPAGAYSIANNLESLPGLSSSAALGDIHIQGSSAGSHEYVLDNALIYMPIKNGSFVGPFSPLAIQNITVQKAGFGARTGSQLAGFIQIGQHSPGENTPLATLQVDPIATNARFSHRFDMRDGRSVDVMLAGRKSFGASLRPSRLVQRFEQWSSPDTFLADQLGLRDSSIDNLDRPVEIDFTDVHSKIIWNLGNTRTLSASTYYGFNVFGSDLFEVVGGSDSRSTDEYQWTNRMTQIKYEWVHGSRAFIQMGVWQSDYRLEHPFTQNPLVRSAKLGSGQEFNEIDQLGGRLSSDFTLGSRSFISAGVSTRVSDSDFVVSSRPLLDEPDLTAGGLDPSRWLVDGYLENTYSISELASLKTGSRFSFIPSHNRVYFEPRVSWRQDVEGERFIPWAYRLSAGIYRQYTSQYDLAPYTESALLPSFRLWIPTGKNDHPPYAYHLTAEFILTPGTHSSVTIESFLKYSPRNPVLNYSRITQGPVADASNRIFGGSLAASWDWSRIGLEGSYSYESSKIKQPHRFLGEWTSSPWESPHRIHFSSRLSLTEHLHADVLSTTILGRSWGYRLSYYNYLPLISSTDEIGALNLDDPESHTLPAFVQIDAGLTAKVSTPTYDLSLRLSVLNVMDRENVVDWMLQDPRALASLGNTRIERKALPRLLLVSLQFSF